MGYKEEGCGNQKKKKSLFSLLISASHKHTHLNTVICLFSWFLSLPSIIRPGFLPIGKHPSFLLACVCQRFCVGLDSTQPRGQKYPPMAPLNGTGHINHRHTALKIQRSSAAAPLVHSLALNRLGNRSAGGPRDGQLVVGDATLKTDSRCGKTMAVDYETN